MTGLRTLLLRLRALVRARQMDRDIDEEIASHLAEAKEEYIQRGLSPEDAHVAALRSFGGVTQTKEVYRQVWSFVWLEDFARNLRFGSRALLRAPGLVVVSVLSLALGIGVNTVLFSAVHSLLFYEPISAEPEPWIVTQPGNSDPFSYLNYRDLAASGIFADVVGYRRAGLVWRSGDGVGRLRGLAVTANFFDALGVQADLGSTFSAEDAPPEQQPRLVVLSYPYWQRRFQGNPGRARTGRLRSTTRYHGVIEPTGLVRLAGAVYHSIRSQTFRSSLDPDADLAPGTDGLILAVRLREHR